MTVCDICQELTMDSITICSDCKRDLDEYDEWSREEDESE